MYRGKHEEKFGPQQITLLNTLAPHLKIAFETRRKLLTLAERVVDLETALDSIGSAVILLDANQNAVVVNRKARALLSRENGIYLQNSKLTGREARDTSQLQRLITKALDNPTRAEEMRGGSMPLMRPGKLSFHVLVSPICSATDLVCGTASVAVFIDDPEEQSLIPVDILRTLFGLTPAEARLALSVLNGHSVSEAAELNCVSRETVKSQMSTVLEKTGTRRQGEMIRLLSRLPGMPA